MSKFVYLYTKIWGDNKFRNLSSCLSKLIFIYLIANDEISLCGIYDFDDEVCKLRLGNPHAFDDAFKEVIDKKFIKYDKENNIVWVINRFRFLTTKSPKLIVAVISELNNIEHPFKQEFINKYKDILTPFLCKLNGHDVSESDLLNVEHLKNLVKVYNGKDGARNFLIRRGIGPEKIDSVLQRIV